MDDGRYDKLGNRINVLNNINHFLIWEHATTGIWVKEIIVKIIVWLTELRKIV